VAATLTPVRACLRTEPRRLVALPLAFLAGAVSAAVLLPPHALAVCLLGFFAWQLWHFAKQNLGFLALAAAAAGGPSPSRRERRWILASALAGILGLVARPGLVEVHLAASARLFSVAAAAFVVAAVGGLAELSRRPAGRPGVLAAGAVAACFSAPIFCAASPFGAVAGMSIAHGVQYLGLLGMVAAGPLAASRRRRRAGVLVATAVLGGAALHVLSGLRGAGVPGRLAFGLYLGCYAAHFAVDARLWRLSVPSSRRFVTAALPTLVRPAARAPSSSASAGTQPGSSVRSTPA
jgi:hypothetical protein